MILEKSICFLLLINNGLLDCLSFRLKVHREKFDSTLWILVIMGSCCANVGQDCQFPFSYCYTSCICRIVQGEIVSNCKSRAIGNSVVVVRHSNSSINWPIEFASNVSLVNLKDSANSDEFQLPTSWSEGKESEEEKVYSYIIVTYSTSNFRRLIGKLRRSRSWKPLAHRQYLIVDDQTGLKGCQEALQFLNTSWHEDLLYATYFCFERGTGYYTMYTYNPYSRRAPETWNEVNPGQYTFDNRVWSLFSQRVIPGKTSCDSFIFSKTSDLNGYPIKAVVVHTGYSVQVGKTKSGRYEISGPDGGAIQVALEALNPELKLTVVWNSSNYYDYVPMISSGQYDICLNAMYIRNEPGVVMTYPHTISAFRFLTQYPEYDEQYLRILRYMNPSVSLIILLLFALTALVLSICAGKGVIRATLEAYRLLLGTTILRPPRGNPLRIYITAVGLLFILTNSIFQSSLSFLLTVPLYKPFIDTEEQLRDSGFLMYVYVHYKSAFTEPWMAERIVTLDTINCTKFVKENPRAACAGEQVILINEADKQNLHISRKIITTLNMGYVVRPNWPPADRISHTLARLNQAGILQYLRSKSVLSIIQAWASADKERRSKRVYHVILLPDLIFAFKILLLGLGFATLTFFFELFFGRKKKD